jgi:hypothetical protein
MRLECLLELLHPPRLDSMPKHILDKRLRAAYEREYHSLADDEGVPLWTNDLIQPLRIALVDGMLAHDTDHCSCI